MSEPQTRRVKICHMRCLVIAGCAAALCATEYVAAQAPASGPVYPAGLDALMLSRLVDAHLGDAQAAANRLVADHGSRSVDNTLRPYDDAQNHLAMADGLAGVAARLHPDSVVRAEGLAALERISRLRATLGADSRVAQAFLALDTAGLSPEERLLTSRIRRDFRRAGVDRDEATRDLLRTHFETLDRLSARFERNLAEDTTIFLASDEELAGMPPDWIAAHQRNAQGRVILTPKYTDFFPLIRYAASRPLRRRAMVAFTNRGWPTNKVVLDSLLMVREAVAHLLDYHDWASYQAETRMTGSPDSIRAFLTRVHAAASPARKRLTDRYLERLRGDDPSVTRLGAWDMQYVAELTRREQHAVDGREVRAYFPFDRVKEGLLGLAGELFDLEFRRADLPVWHPSVEAYEAWEQGRMIGHFYLDLHPRPGKYTHAAASVFRLGITGRQLPAAVLMTNFPGGEPGDPGLMEHSGGAAAVTTFFHEFGHLLHILFASRPYLPVGFEHDFVEAPSQMLEEWLWHPAVLRRISRHVETGAPIPDSLVERMRAAAASGRPLNVAVETAFSAMSLGLHDRPATMASPDSLGRWAMATYAGVAVDPGMHWPTSFSHLGMNDYSATYYGYLWSQVIAKDLWSAFDRTDPLDPEPARRYRDLILRPGGSRPATELVREFLGRPFNLVSWQRWLEGG